MYKLILLSIILFLSSCASMSDITPIGKDTYMLANSSNAPAQSGGELKAKLIQKASIFCTEQNKKVMLVGFSAVDMAFGRTASSEITFRCLLETDPEYKRPTPEYKNSPGGNTSTGVLLNIN